MKIYLSCLLFTLTSLTDVASVPLSSEPTPSDPVNGGNVTSTEPNVSNETISPSPVVGTFNSSTPQVNSTTSSVPAGLGDLSNVLCGLPEIYSAVSAVPGLRDLLNFMLTIFNSALTAMSGSPLVNALSSIPASILVFRSLLANLMGFPGLSVEPPGESTDIGPGLQSLLTVFSVLDPTGTLLNSMLTLLISTYTSKLNEGT